ncbi:MAG: dynamin family protein [Hyphomicrobiaceae bacterium]|nr:dynamin family protein [Hyphomicrobiaceae bacterium]
MRDTLSAAAERLADVVEPSARTLVWEAAKLLNRQVCRIVVIGQIKSGKSTFVNACAQSRALLPTDVNPWTTAVTNLHFRQHKAGDPVASFQFFTEDEWQRIAKGGGVLRELTERLVPGFEPELLAQHVAALRQRAAQRLGADYHTLIGQSHAFGDVSPEILARYVCAGDSDAEGFFGTSVPSDIGRYADITRSADIHLDGGPFAFPTTLIDTPGTNDPFLLRDEITRRSLEQADLSIIVLTARQPLGDADVALLRILKGLNKERIIVFINRIDDLDDVSGDLSEVQAFVRRRIARELPDANIPIIAGSARWANEAVNGSGRPGGSVPDNRALAYLIDTGLVRREDVVRPAAVGQSENPEFRRALFAASGMPAVYNAIGEMMAISHPALVIRQVASCYAEMAAVSEAGARGELRSLVAINDASRSTAEAARSQIEQMSRELSELEQAASIIERSARSIEAQMKEIVGEEMARLRGELTSEVEHHAAEERDVLIDTLRRGRAPREWTCEALGLRRTLGVIFENGFNRARARLADLKARVTPELNQLIGMISPAERPHREPVWQGTDVPRPQLASLSAYVALDLGTSWWTAFFARRPSPEERGEEIERLIRAEFDPVIEELIASAESTLQGYSGTVASWSSGICRAIIDAIQRRRDSLNTSRSSLSQSVDGKADPLTLARQDEEITRLRSRLEAANAAAGLIDDVMAGLATMRGVARRT